MPIVGPITITMFKGRYLVMLNRLKSDNIAQGNELVVYNWTDCLSELFGLTFRRGGSADYYDPY